MLKWLEDWYKSQCDGDWEHSYGIQIGNIDNPGWLVDIDLRGTELEEKHFDTVKSIRDDADWINCRVENSTFKGRGGAHNLEEILTVFKKWVDNN